MDRVAVAGVLTAVLPALNPRWGEEYVYVMGNDKRYNMLYKLKISYAKATGGGSGLSNAGTGGGVIYKGGEPVSGGGVCSTGGGKAFTGGGGYSVGVVAGGGEPSGDGAGVPTTGGVVARYCGGKASGDGGGYLIGKGGSRGNGGYLKKGQKNAEVQVTGENCSFPFRRNAWFPLAPDLKIIFAASWLLCMGHGAPDAL
ncbi:hypothetical protein RJ640_017197 [Escallonia rubra]|uniref:Uncharacterized protein n=1 Tax=Escallonia rubra TaxID=112253 RepID=A0AA88R6U3_9ASTE|nr:hypothetical protein RJ640_017197 [Escallonia rubra]